MSEPAVSHVRWIGGRMFLRLTHGKIYKVLSMEHGWYRIRDDTLETGLYPPDRFAPAVLGL